MIFDVLTSAVLISLRGLIDLMPVATIPNLGWAHDAAVVYGYAAGLDAVLPISYISAGLGVAFVYVGLSYGYHGVNWIYRHIPFVGGG